MFKVVEVTLPAITALIGGVVIHPVIGGLLAILVALALIGFVFAASLAIAPIRQRDEARNEWNMTVTKSAHELARKLTEARRNAKETIDALRAENDVLQERLDDRERLKAVRTTLAAYAAQGKAIARQGRRAPDHKAYQDWSMTATKWFDEVRAFLGESIDEGEVEVFADTTGVQPTISTNVHQLSQQDQDHLYRVRVVEHCVGNLVCIIRHHQP